MSLGSGVKNINTDILVIGAGYAGFFAAIKAKEQGLDVTLTDKAYAGKAGSTHFSEGDMVFFRPERGHNVKEWVDVISQRCDDITWTREALTCKVKGPDGYMYEPDWINPQEAEKRGIKSSDIVRIYNERGGGAGWCLRY